MNKGNFKDLRNSFLIVFIPFCIILIGLFSYSNLLISWINNYYSLNLVALGITENFAVQFKLSMIVALLSLIPLITYAMYKFIKPAYNIKPYLFKIIASQILAVEGFILGATYLSKIIMNNLNSFVIVEGYYSLNNVLTFGLGIGFAVAISFQLILLIPLLKKWGIINPSILGKKSFALLMLAYLISAIVTPPDLVSTFIIMIPLCFSYVIGVSISKIYKVDGEKIKC